MIKLRKANRHEKKDYPNALATIIVGKHEAQLTQKDIESLHSKLNKFAIHSVTLRDELAMHALTGLVSNVQYFNPDKKHKMIVEPRIFARAYSMADGMLKARNGG